VTDIILMLPCAIPMTQIIILSADNTGVNFFFSQSTLPVTPDEVSSTKGLTTENFENCHSENFDSTAAISVSEPMLKKVYI